MIIKADITVMTNTKNKNPKDFKYSCKWSQNKPDIFLLQLTENKNYLTARKHTYRGSWKTRRPHGTITSWDTTFSLRPFWAGETLRTSNKHRNNKNNNQTKKKT